jgi:PKD repeat protein
MKQQKPSQARLRQLLCLLLLLLGIQAVNAQTPVPYQPTSGLSIVDTFTTLKWASVSSATSYRIQVSTNVTFTGIVKDTNLVVPTQLNIYYLLHNQTYYWRVLANTGGGPGAWSADSKFTVFQPSDLDSNLMFWVPIESNSVTKDGTNHISFAHDHSKYHHPLKMANPTYQPVFQDSIRTLNYTGIANFAGNQYLKNDSILDSLCTMIMVLDGYNGDTRNAIASITNSFGFIGFGDWTGALDYEAFSWCADTPYIAYAMTSIRTPISRDFNVITYNYDNLRNNYNVYLNGVRVPMWCYADTVYGIKKMMTQFFCAGSRYWAGQYFTGNFAEIIGCRKAQDSTSIYKLHNYLFSKMAPPANLGPDISINYGFCNSLSLNPGSHFKSYLWNTGDTSRTLPVSSSGTFWVTCTDVFGRVSRDTVQVVLRDVLNQLHDTSFCVGGSVRWGTRMPRTYRFLWQDGTTDTMILMNHPGNYYCRISDTIGCHIYTDTVHVSVDSFAYKNSIGRDTSFCSGNPLGISISTHTATHYAWSTGDTTASTQVFSSGNYSVTMTDPQGCVARDTAFVSVVGVAPLASMFTGSGCLGDTTIIQDRSTATSPEHIAYWKWYFGDGDSAAVSNPNHYYSASGTYRVSLTVRTDSGCASSTSRNVLVSSSPTANFASVVACQDAAVTFNDLSTAPIGDSVVYWHWSFNGVDSAFVKNPRYTFHSTGAQIISLTVRSIAGCAKEYIDTISVAPPIHANFSFNGACIGDTTTFQDATPSLSIIAREWNIDNGALYAFTRTPKYIFPASGDFMISLKVTNAIGCVDSMGRSIHIFGLPTASFADSVGCLNIPYSFHDASTAAPDTINQWLWHTDTSFYHAQNPAVIYHTSGTHVMNLQVTTVHGCKASFAKPIQIQQPPVVDFSFNPTFGEAPLLINFQNNSSGADHYSWNFGDGIGTSTSTNPSYTYNNNGNYNIVLSAFTNAGCVDSAVKYIAIRHSDLDLMVDNLILNENTLPGGAIQETFSVRLTNVGTRDITKANLLARVENSSVLLEQWTGMLHPGETVNHLFTNGFYLSTLVNAEYLCVEAKQVNDSSETNLTNNKACANLHTDVAIGEPYPVPTLNDAFIDAVLKEPTTINIGVYNMLGQAVVPAADFAGDKGLNTFRVSCSGLGYGQYFMRIKYFNETVIKRLEVGM